MCFYMDLLPPMTVQKIQLAQDTAKAALAGTCTQEHNTWAQTTAHWLPICFGVQFKTLVNNTMA